MPLVPAAVLAQVTRSARQAQLRRVPARMRRPVPLDEEPTARAAGRLIGAARTADVVDACVVVVAMRWRARIVTGDPDDIEALVAASGSRLTVVAR